MPKITAPPSPAAANRARVAELHGKGSKRTPAEAAELLDLVAQLAVKSPA